MSDGVTRLGHEVVERGFSDEEAANLSQPPTTIGQWRQVHVAGADRLGHFSIEIDPARPGVIEKYVAVVYVTPTVSANYFRGESLYSFDEALERAAGLIASKDALVVEDY